MNPRKRKRQKLDRQRRTHTEEDGVNVGPVEAPLSLGASSLRVGSDATSRCEIHCAATHSSLSSSPSLDEDVYVYETDRDDSHLSKEEGREKDNTRIK